MTLDATFPKKNLKLSPTEDVCQNPVIDKSYLHFIEVTTGCSFEALKQENTTERLLDFTIGYINTVSIGLVPLS